MRQTWLPALLAVAAVVLVNVVLCQESTGTKNETTAPKKNATYWVTVSNKFWLGGSLQLTVQILTGSDPVSVTVSITQQSYEINSTVETLFTSAATNVYPGAPENLKFDVPSTIKAPENSWSKMYNIVVVGKGNTVNFNHTDYLHLQTKSISVYVVTNKGIYKPGQTVKFRALAMEPDNLKVLQDPMDIVITDTKGNRIKQYKGVVGTAGVVDQSFSLAASTPSGDWTISATVRGQTETKTFTVDEYVLPKFEVTVSPPAIPLSSDTRFPIKIKALYTFGQPVINGSVVVRVSMYYPWYDSPQSEATEWTAKGKLDSNGEVTLTVTSKELAAVVMAATRSFYSLDYQQFRVEANVTEGNSQRVQSGSASMPIYSRLYSLQFLPITSTSFKTNMPFYAYAEVTKSDGTRLSLQETSSLKVQFNVTYEVPLPPEEQETTTVSPSGTAERGFGKGIWFPMPRRKTKVLQLNDSVRTISDAGFVNIAFVVPSDALSVTVVASLNKPYNDTQGQHYASPFKSPSNNTIQLTAPLKSPKVGETITFIATATEPVKMLVFQVLSKGKVVSDGTVSSPTKEGSKTLSIDVEITQKMAPTMTLLSFYIRDQDSEIVPDSVTLPVDGLFQNEVSVQFDKDKVKPGEDLNMVIKAKPDSILYVVSNDKSVNLLKSGNTMTQDMIRDDLASYSFGSYFPSGRYMFICGWPVGSSGLTAAAVFRNAEMHFFTDGGLLEEEPYAIAYMDKGGMLAAPAAAAPVPENSGAPKSVLAAEKVRKFFPETWIWDIYVLSDSKGEMVVAVTAPDTITSFEASIFSVHPIYGLSVGKNEAVVTIFRDLFVSVDLPPFIIRFENLCFTASVFSYYQGEIPVFLKLDSSDQFNGSRVSRQGDSVIVIKEKMAFTDYYGDVKENEVKTSTFCITPLVIGDVTLKISALTDVPGLSDAVEQVISVKPEGVHRSTTNNFLVNLTTTFWQQEAKINFPPETVADSQLITVNIAGSIIGPMLENIQDLLRQPYGCGEQNMLNFAPSVSVAKFLLVTGRATPELITRFIDYITTGYQTELTYMHTSGGFSAFGMQDKNASTWLTAFVINCLSQASNLNDEYDNILQINLTDVINFNVRFLISNQNPNGSITEPGVVFHKEMQGKSANGEALTAYTLISVIEAAKTIKGNSTFSAEIQGFINRAAEYLAGRTETLTDAYDLSIVSYALHLCNHTLRNSIFAKVEALAQTGDGFKFWKSEDSQQEAYAKYAWSNKADSIWIETTSYNLLTYQIRGVAAADVLPVVRWLTNQGGPNGGFVSTQDTVIGIQALTRVMAKLYQQSNSSLTVTVSYIDGDGQSQSAITHINKESEMMLQKVFIQYKNKAPASLTITANTDDGRPGPSTVLVIVSQDFNVKGETLALCYNMSHNVVKSDDTLTLTIRIATVTNKTTSMSTLAVQIPAGYTIIEEEVKKNDNVSRVDPFDGETLFVYYDSGVIDTKGVKIFITMYRTDDALTDAKPRSYTISDYYLTNCIQTQNYTWNRDHVCVTVPDNGICRYVKGDVPEVTSQ